MEYGQNISYERKKYGKITKKDWYRTALVLFIFIIVIVLSSMVLLPSKLQLWKTF
ncbi:hypothetical protein [Methanosarcina horonobensis]|uniref:hypothetical protein n=1 Tax=Methanosarcina horonobensis TaxID=418008 RepID=UPI000A9B973F|nr:hypothetical protein [Methanosarcina horonobensis]